MKKLLVIACLPLILVAAACDVEQTREGEMPDIDVDVSSESGQMPKYDVNWADVDIGTRTKTVTVPKLIVVQEEIQVEVPYIDVTMPDETDADKRERTVTVEIELEGESHEIDIEEIYAIGQMLIVVTRLEPTGQDLGDERIRISDRVVVNAGNLDVRHYIIGQRPDGDWNSQYRFVNSKSEIGVDLADAALIYSD